MISSPYRSPARARVASPLPPREPRGPGRLLLVCVAYVALFFAVSFGAQAVVSCGPHTREDVKGVVDKAAPIADMGCALGSTLSDAEELAAICGFEKALIPFLRQIVSYRDEGRRAGVVWRPCAADGGGLCAGGALAADAGKRDGAP